MANRQLAYEGGCRRFSYWPSDPPLPGLGMAPGTCRTTLLASPALSIPSFVLIYSNNWGYVQPVISGTLIGLSLGRVVVKRVPT